MRLRNNLLALAILLGFLGLGVLYVRFWVVQRPYGIIIFVSDGLVTRHITAARLYENGALHRLEMEKFPHSAMLRNDPLQFAVPDAASAASALATGKPARLLQALTAGHIKTDCLSVRLKRHSCGGSAKCRSQKKMHRFFAFKKQRLRSE